MRHNINKFLYASFVACILIGGLLFTSCDKDEEDLTTVKLSAFGPSPALRGGELKFIGANLDKVSAVVLPENIEITTFVSKTANELVIAIPQNTAPGLVTLKTPQGDITTKTPLTFTEPISIESVAPAAVKAGDVFTINGDYLNLIAQVIFSDGIAIDSADFISQSRYKIEVTVPIEAQTGKVIISNGAEIPVLVYTANEVQVTLPAVTSVAPNPVKPGTELQINGTNFQLVKSLVFADGITVDNFTVNTAKTQITANVPANTKEGSIKLVAFSGVEVEVTTPLSLISPAITSITPNPVKNGATLTVAGTNLDLVIGATFGGDVTGVILSQSATKLEITVPLTATEGKVVLNTNSGKTAESAVLTFVRPTISSIAPLALVAGNDITITGTNLDLVSKVKFGGGLSVDVTNATATSLKVTVPMAATSGKITLITTNGTEIESTDALAVEAANKPVITGVSPSTLKPGQKLTFSGSKLHLVEAIYFGTIKAVLYGIRTESSIEVYVPETAAPGKQKAKFVAFDGAEVMSPEFSVTGTDPILSSTIMITNFDGGGNSQSTWGSSFTFGTPAVDLNGTAAMIGKSGVTTSWDWLWAANWGAIPSLPNPEKYVIKMDICITKPVSGITMGMCLKGWDISVNLGDIFSTSTNGQWATLTFDVLNSSMVIDGTKDWGLYISGASATYDFSGIMIDNLRFDLKSSASSAPRLKLIGF